MKTDSTIKQRSNERSVIRIKSIKVTIPHYSNRANMMIGEIDKYINTLAISTYDDIPLTIEYDMDDGTAFCSSFNIIK